LESFGDGTLRTEIEHGAGRVEVEKERSKLEALLQRARG
jgi:hypothetical protein